MSQAVPSDSDPLKMIHRAAMTIPVSRTAAWCPSHLEAAVPARRHSQRAPWAIWWRSHTAGRDGPMNHKMMANTTATMSVMTRPLWRNRVTVLHNASVTSLGALAWLMKYVLPTKKTAMNTTMAMAEPTAARSRVFRRSTATATAMMSRISVISGRSQPSDLTARNNVWTFLTCCWSSRVNWSAWWSLFWSGSKNVTPLASSFLTALSTTGVRSTPTDLSRVTAG